MKSLLLVLVSGSAVVATAAPSSCLTGFAWGPSETNNTIPKNYWDYLNKQYSSPPVSKPIPKDADNNTKCVAVITPNWPHCSVSAGISACACHIICQHNVINDNIRTARTLRRTHVHTSSDGAQDDETGKAGMEVIYYGHNAGEWPDGGLVPYKPGIGVNNGKTCAFVGVECATDNCNTAAAVKKYLSSTIQCQTHPLYTINAESKVRHVLFFS